MDNRRLSMSLDFLVLISDPRVRVWHKQYAAAGVVVWGIFSWHFLVFKKTRCVNATSYLSIVADFVHPVIITVCT